MIHKRLNAAKNSVFSKTLRRGMLCSLIPLLFMSLCIFLIDFQRSLNQVGSITADMLSKSDQMASYIIEDMERSTVVLTKSPSVVDFAMRPYLEDISRNNNLCTLLNTLSGSYDYVRECALFSPSESLRISSSGLISYTQDERFLQFFEIVSASGSSYLQIDDPGQATQKMFLAVGIPAYSTSPQAIAVLQIDLQIFFTVSMGSPLQSSKRNLYVLDSAGNTLFSDMQLTSPSRTAATLHSSQLSTEPQLTLSNTGLLQRSTLTSRNLSWEYCYETSLLPGDSSWFALAVPLLISVLSSCGIGLMLAYQSTKVLYSPLEQLLSALPEPSGAAEIPQDEYQRLSDYYGNLLNQMDEVCEQTEAIRPLLLKKFLISLADGTKISANEILYQIQVLGVPFRMTLFNAFCLQIDNYYSLPYSEDEKREIKEQMQAQISACASSTAYCITAELTDETFLIVCNLLEEDTPENGKQAFRELAEEMRIEIEALWPITVTLGIGQVCRSPEDLPLSCQRAKAALAYKLYQGKGRIIDLEEVKTEPPQTHLELNKIHQVINSVRGGDEKSTARLLRELFAAFSAHQQVPPKQVREILQYLVSGIGEIARTAQPTETLGAQTELDTELARRTTLPDIEKWLTLVCLQTAEAVKNSSSERIRQNAERVKTYIDKNLTQDISLSSISAYVGYSPTYISKVFHQYYGTSYIDYLNSNRTRLSQTLLLEQQELSVKEIGFQVGFNNLQSFFRIFKKYTGMTPLQYREKAIRQSPDQTDGRSHP